VFEASASADFHLLLRVWLESSRERTPGRHPWLLKSESLGLQDLRMRGRLAQDRRGHRSHQASIVTPSDISNDYQDGRCGGTADDAKEEDNNPVLHGMRVG